MKRNIVDLIFQSDRESLCRPLRRVRLFIKNRPFLIGITILLVAGASGCVSSATHERTLTELKEARKQAEADETTKAQLYLQATEAQEKKNKFYNKLMNAEEQNRQLEAQIQQITESADKVRLERDGLKTKSDDLERKLETARQDLSTQAQVSEEKSARIAELTKNEQDLNQALGSARGEIRELTIKLDATQAQVTDLQGDKQRLLGGTTTAQSEIARLQKRAGELETEAARAKDLEEQLEERDQVIGELRHRLVEHDTIVAALASQSDESKSVKQRVDQLTAEMATMGEELASVTRERDKLSEELASLKLSHEQALASLEAQKTELTRLEGEKAAKEEEIKRLTGTYQDLEKSLRSEIAQGDIKIKQVRDRLTINVVDRILFDSGSAKIKPAGLKVLKTVGDVLKGVADKQIRIDGHTDNVPISSRLQDRFKTNWELSTARATSVVRYLIDEVGLAPTLLTAAGHADTQPVAENDSEEGRTQNRRIEIALYPEDLEEIAEGITSE